MELLPTNSVAFNLRSDPAVATSSTYKVTARVIEGAEDIRTLIGWSRDIDKILAGLNLNQDAQFNQAVRVTSSMMRGRVTSTFNREIRTLKTLRLHARANQAYEDEGGNAAAKDAAKQDVIDQGWEDDRNNQFGMIRLSLNKCLKAMMPRKVLARCKRHLRRHCRKPKGMRVREYMQLVNNMNREEFPKLPPFDPNQYLPDDEILDIILFGTPKSWEREMDKQGFDPFSHQLNDVVDKLEDIETAEGFDAEATKVTTKKDKKKPAKAKGNNNKSSNNTTENGNKKHCLFHGWGGHSTDECERLKSQVKKLKAEKSGNEKTNNNNSKKDDKKSVSWKKKAEDAKGNDSFVTFMNETVQRTVNDAVSNGKRKSDDDSTGSIAALKDIEDMDLSEFDYQKMEDIVIEDNGDITI